MLIKIISISLVLSTIIFFNACSSNVGTNKVPKCSDVGVVDTLSKILSTKNKKAVVHIDTIRKKLDLNKQNEKRTCRAKFNYFYSVSKNTSLVDEKSKNNQVFYTVVSSETGKKYIVNVIELSE